MIPPFIRIKNNELPSSPGVYLMKDKNKKVIYVGKAVSLNRRVRQHFDRPHGPQIPEMTRQVVEIDYIEKPTALEALVLEANLIKHFWPKYNVLQKDNKSFMYLGITDEDFPRPLLVRGTDLDDETAKKYKVVFGPYTSSRSLKAALDLVRKAFPWSTCIPGQKRACFYHHLKLCPGVCVDAVDKKVYQKTIRDLTRFFEGKKEDILKDYQKQMVKLSKERKYEEAGEIRNKVYFLEHIQDVAVLKRDDELVDKIRPGEGMVVNLFGRIEGYDISNISGTSQVASMVVFESGAPAKAEYRKFKIKTVEGPNDVASLRETLMRRFKHDEWRMPDLILIDGGLPQVHAAEEVMHHLNIQIPVVGIAKGAQRKRNDIICSQVSIELCELCRKYVDLLAQVRDEAHRFAITFHRSVRSKAFLGKKVDR
ncbi:GIY-YIG nuclease family protein [Candidatus Uhrbacteria bacterium]|nr:GIY-YIG nuclease family protein [Candidatus Uhrbacteria bacterium]